MNHRRWLDHLPPWLSFGAILATGAFGAGDHLLMMLPLLAAALVEALRLGLGPWRRLLEILALGAVLGLIPLRLGLVPTVLIVLFLLCGVRLSLPKGAPERRQILLMSFLVFLVTSIAADGTGFLVWCILWLVGAMILLMQQAWESAAGAHRQAHPAPPFRSIPRWILATMLMGGCIFLIVPRFATGFRGMFWKLPGTLGGEAGLSDRLSLETSGPIRSSGTTVLRVMPARPRSDQTRLVLESRLALLPAIVLETLDGQRWQASPNTPLHHARLSDVNDGPIQEIEIHVMPTPDGILPLPYGASVMSGPRSYRLETGSGASLRWRWPLRHAQILPVAVSMANQNGDTQPPVGPRLVRLLDVGRDTEAALRWSLDHGDKTLPVREQARRLAASFRHFRYTTENPSGNAKNPLQDFLEQTQAGHCEYFASALAIMLRYQGIPSRIVNGFRLGPWISEGGYWIVTTDEAHSWVEFWDETQHRWSVLDPTPAAPPSFLARDGFAAAMSRWADTLSYRWDRYVVRFSSEDQLNMVDWLQEKPTRFLSSITVPHALRWGLGCLAAGLGLIVLFRRFRGLPVFREQMSTHTIRALRPLLRRTVKTHPPLPGESARAWLSRLAAHRTEQGHLFQDLAREVDATAYGRQPDKRLHHLVQAALKAWRP